MLTFGAAALAAVLAIATFTLVALTLGADLPDNWGFRGYNAVLALAFATCGALVALRRPENVLAPVLAAIGLASGWTGFAQEYATYALILRPGALPGAVPVAWVNSWLWLSMMLGLSLALVLFPTGSIPSPRWRPAVAYLVVPLLMAVPTFAFKPGPLENFVALENPLPASGALEDLRRALDRVASPAFLVATLLAASAPIVRARRAAGRERQQLKWLALSGAYFAFALAALLGAGAPKWAQLLMITALISVPGAMTLAILRYRLYDVDLVVNRAIVYSALTMLLALTYGACVLALTALVRPVTGTSDAAVAASTLAVVALFHPLRARVQRAVDTRFYRSRHDAQRVLDAFATRVRDEVDLDALRAELVRTARDTVRPAHASVWVRSARR